MKIRRKRVQPMIPLASMGDIAFLLIIFFMLTSNFMKQANLEVTEATSPDVEVVEKAPITVTLDRDSILWFEGQQMTPDALSSEIRAMVMQHGQRPVHVRIDQEAVKKDFMPVIEALSSESPGQIVFLGMPSDD